MLTQQLKKNCEEVKERTKKEQFSFIIITLRIFQPCCLYQVPGTRTFKHSNIRLLRVLLVRTTTTITTTTYLVTTTSYPILHPPPAATATTTSTTRPTIPRVKNLKKMMMWSTRSTVRTCTTPQTEKCFKVLLYT